ncbi:WD repeat and FYVE domain-containing protein 1 isoform X1 [Peromyscus leucopus]|uniref:WD repeat and FYVE domain-containing protein 1 isoform X1 n=2 Tax=Peromyscus leucopus TaxID=10041 RepID=UPI001884F391|nr:WD repeat and FYVE domain-containing protein 1 isoform X1 [Peromyscus leucopus]
MGRPRGRPRREHGGRDPLQAAEQPPGAAEQDRGPPGRRHGRAAHPQGGRRDHRQRGQNYPSVAEKRQWPVLAQHLPHNGVLLDLSCLVAVYRFQLPCDQAPCSSMAYHHDSRRIFVGQDNGAIMEFHVSEDFNKMNFIKTYPAHQNRVSAIIFSLAAEWVISTGHDKCVSWMCTRSGNMLGRHFFASWASCLQYDLDTQHAFIGDYSGQITLLKLEQSTCSVITTLKGHEGSVACLWWDPLQRLLFSGASDNSIIMWDIGGRKGRTLLLQGHHDRVQSLCYLQLTRQLVSCSSDGGIAVWNMDVSREEAPQWLESDSCQKCEQPFFWNIKQMWDTKTLGLRQHHCRKCGQAVCGKCSSKRSSYPVMGFEFQVRVCDSCYDSIKDEDRTSLATFHEGKHNISHMSMDIARGLMVTCGTDRVVKIWDMTPVVGCSLATGFSPH